MEFVLILILVVVASAVGTVTGFGLSTVMIPVMTLFYALPETLLFVGIIHWFNDLWKLLLFREGLRWKLILSFGLPGIVATVVAARLVFAVSGTVLARILGVFLIGYVVFLFVRSAFKIRPSPLAGALGGALSGFFAGVFGMGWRRFTATAVLGEAVWVAGYVAIGWAFRGSLLALADFLDDLGWFLAGLAASLVIALLLGRLLRRRLSRRDARGNRDAA